MKKIAFNLIMVFGLFAACQKSGKVNGIESGVFEILDFQPLLNAGEINSENISVTDTLVTLMADYRNAIDGFRIPSVFQAQANGFVFRFRIQNNSHQPTQFVYKLYYRNESYKFNASISQDGLIYNPLASENFYGSWESTDINFKSSGLVNSGESLAVVDTFAIVGNPRAEAMHFVNGKNQRWQRNPRVGVYSFLLVVLDAKANIDQYVPPYISDISKKADSLYIDPYYFFNLDSIRQKKGIRSVLSETRLKLIASPNPTSGIWINMPHSTQGMPKIYSRQDCDTSYALYLNAGFSQFVHTILEDTRMDNIPLIKDVIADGYSKMEYNWHKAFIRKEELVSIIPTAPRYPCETVYSDFSNQKIIMKNPASKPGDFRKENTGVITRHGFTYGKYRVKAKLPSLLNKDFVWNGVTNAIWLINQSNDTWNQLRDCKQEGYMASYTDGGKNLRVTNTSYSEIDFEILKNVPYCPRASFPPISDPQYSVRKNIYLWNVTQPEEIVAFDPFITVACTNWDMACPVPLKYDIGCQPVSYLSKTFQAHRWDKNYRALTIKTPALNAELFESKFYYFEIEWKPTEIIWRIGPTIDQLRVVAYMNDEMTSIPNNQMLLIIDQEFHNTKWWPGAPYDQANIPFPAKDIIGEIYEVWIE